MTATAEATRYAVGERVTYTKRGDRFTGEATVVEVDNVGTPTLVRFDDVAQGWPRRDPATGERLNGHWNVEYGDTYTRQASVPVPVDPESAAADVIRLRADVEILRSQLDASTTRHLSDLRVIGEALRETSERHEWCDEYDRHVSDLLPNISDIGRDTFRESATVDREREFTVAVTVSATTTVSVSARSADEAREQFEEDPHAYLPYASGYDIDSVDVDSVDDEW